MPVGSPQKETLSIGTPLTAEQAKHTRDGRHEQPVPTIAPPNRPCFEPHGLDSVPLGPKHLLETKALLERLRYNHRPSAVQQRIPQTESQQRNTCANLRNTKLVRYLRT